MGVFAQRPAGSPASTSRSASTIAVDATKHQPTEGWRADPAVGGGPLLEGGVHWVDLMANAGLEVTGARGVPMGEDPVTGRRVLATFTYAGGAAGELRFSWDAHAVLGGVRLSHLHGTDGTLTFESNGAFLLARGRHSWRRSAAPSSSALPRRADQRDEPCATKPARGSVARSSSGSNPDRRRHHPDRRHRADLPQRRVLAIVVVV